MPNFQTIVLDTATPQLRAPGTGDGYSFDSGATNLGSWTTTGLTLSTGNLTLTPGTANGVLYLNASKVATSGSGFAFNGTDLTLPVEGYRASATSYLRLSGGNGAGSGGNLIVYGQTHATAPGRVTVNAVGTGYVDFNAGGAERMRLTSAGELLVGGTTSLDATSGRLSVQSSSGGYITLFRNDTSIVANDPMGALSVYGNDTTGNTPRELASVGVIATGTHAAGDNPTAITFSTTASGSETPAERMRITAAGELLVGGTTAISSASGAVTIQRTGNATLNFFRDDTTVVSGEALGVINFYGNDTTSNTPTQLARIIAEASGTHAAGDNPTDISFHTTPDGTETVAEAGRITQAGSYVLKGGTTTAAAGVGIIFPATQVASANANSLDDYEEGTWTPTTSTSGYTISSSSAVYTKVGRLVHCRFVVQFSAVGAGNSVLIIAGYPFAAAGATPGAGTDDTTSGAIYACSINNNLTNGSLNSYSGITAGSARTFATNENYIFSITYQV